MEQGAGSVEHRATLGTGHRAEGMEQGAGEFMSYPEIG